MEEIVSEILRPQDVEEKYKIPVDTLAKWRSQRVGPAYSKAGRRILYRQQDLDAFLDRCKQQTTGRLP